MKRFVYILTVFSTMILSNCQNDGDAVAPQQPQGKLDYYTETFDVTGLGFPPQYKVAYEYDALGRLSKTVMYAYNPNSKKMEQQSHSEFTYVDNRVNKMTEYLVGFDGPYIEDTYQYLPDNRVSRIKEDNHGAAVTSEANFHYDASDNLVTVSYTYSNGGSFDYVFDYTNENIVSDETKRGSQLCSDGAYTYDQQKNPFKELGYVDYNLTNISVNNKLTENVNYVACAFPTLVPESYSYQYNDSGYPVTAITYYKSTGSLKKSEKKFFYK